MEEGSLEPRPSNGFFVGPGKTYPVALLFLAVTSAVVLFVGPIASAGESLLGSDLSWAAVVSASTGTLYGSFFAIHQWRNRKLQLVPDQILPTRITEVITHAAVTLGCVGIMVVLAAAPSASWALNFARALGCIASTAMIVSGAHQLYSGAKFVEAQRLMNAYEAVLNCESSSVPLSSHVWEECAAAQRVLGKEIIQAERIHFLEAQKAELAAELLRLATRPSEPEAVADQRAEQDVLKLYDQQKSQLRCIQASQKNLEEQLERSQAVSTELNQASKKTELELQAERELNERLTATMDQMKSVLQTAVQARDDARYKYKMLKKSVTKMVTGNIKSEVKTESAVWDEARVSDPMLPV